MSEVILTGEIGEGKRLELHTPTRLTGKLNHFIIKQPDGFTIGIEILSKRFPEVVFFRHVSLQGDQLIPIRVRPRDRNNDGFSYGNGVRYVVNEILTVIVKGATGRNIEIIINYDKGEE